MNNLRSNKTARTIALIAALGLSTGTAIAPSIAHAAVQSTNFNAKATATNTTATLTWDTSSRPGKGWEVGRDGVDKDGYGAWKGTVSSTTGSQTFKDLVTGKTYNLYVKNLDTGQQATVAVNPGDVSSQHTLTTENVSGTQVKVKWSSTTSPTKGWEVGRDGTDTTGTGSWSGTFPGGNREQTFNFLKSGVTYNFYVKNLDNGSVVRISGKTGGSTTPTPPPASGAYKLTSTGHGSDHFGFQTNGLPSGGKLQMVWTRNGQSQSTTTTSWSWWSGHTQSGWTSAKANVLNSSGQVVATSATITQGRGSTTPTNPPTTPTNPTPTNPPTNPTNPTPPASGYKVGQRSGLKFDLGVFAHSPDRVKRFEQAVGRKVDVYQVAPQRHEGFGVMLSETRRIMGYVPEGAKVDLAIPLMSYSEAQQLGRVLQETGHGDAYVRPGWEFNLGGMGWAWTVDQIGYDTYIKKFRENANGFRSTAPNVKMEWNPNVKTKGFNHAVKAYPGDAYVDVVGVDVYNWSYEDSWSGDGGLNQWLDFTKQHGKKMSLPEWGVHGGKDGGGDNAAYIARMLNWVNANRDTIVMASYFDEPASYIKNSLADGQMPRSRDAFRNALSGM